jgi:putative FmdB family regulatory protein
VPIYGYRCNSCGHEFEVYQRMSDDPVEVCPNCQGKVNRKLYPTGVVFKGSGYYSTDYKDSGKSSASSNGSDASTGSTESKSEPKSESKSDSSD